MVSHVVEDIKQAESKAERSLMHRFNLAKVILSSLFFNGNQGRLAHVALQRYRPPAACALLSHDCSHKQHYYK